MIQFFGPLIFEIERDSVGQIGFVYISTEPGCVFKCNIIIFGNFEVVPEIFDLVEPLPPRSVSELNRGGV